MASFTLLPTDCSSSSTPQSYKYSVSKGNTRGERGGGGGGGGGQRGGGGGDSRNITREVETTRSRRLHKYRLSKVQRPQIN